MSTLSQAPEPTAAVSVGEDLDLATLWADLTTGRCHLVDSFYWEGRCFVMLQQRAAPVRDRRLAPKRVEVLKRILLGESQKAVAIDFRLAVSTVALTCSQCLRAMGDDHVASRVPALLVMAAHADEGFELAPAIAFRTAPPDSDGRWTASVERPDTALPALLTNAESDVTRLLVEGLTHAEIARLRRRSPRTIANQLASVFAKMQVSGRSELISKLVRARLAERTPANEERRTQALASAVWVAAAPVADRERPSVHSRRELRPARMITRS